MKWPLDDVQDLVYSALTTDAERNEAGEEGANVVDGLFAIARALERVGRAIDRLGNADAATPMGGLEALGGVLKDGMEQMASAISGLREP
jgi:hypothetical protein